MLNQIRNALFACVLLLLAPGAMAATPADTLVIAKNIDDIITFDPAEAYEFTGIEIIANIYTGSCGLNPLILPSSCPALLKAIL